MRLSGSVKLYWLWGSGVWRHRGCDRRLCRVGWVWARHRGHGRLALRPGLQCGLGRPDGRPPTLPALQGRGYLVAPQIHPELSILCGIQGLRRGLQRLDLRAQPRLFLLHAPIAHGLAFAGVGAHFGAVRHQSGE